MVENALTKVLFASKNIPGSTLQGVGTYNLSHQSDYKIQEFRKLKEIYSEIFSATAFDQACQV